MRTLSLSACMVLGLLLASCANPEQRAAQAAERQSYLDQVRSGWPKLNKGMTVYDVEKLIPFPFPGEIVMREIRLRRGREVISRLEAPGFRNKAFARFDAEGAEVYQAQYGTWISLTFGTTGRLASWSNSGF